MKCVSKLMMLVIFAEIVFNVGCAGTPVRIGSTIGQDFDATKGRSISASASGFQLFLLIPIMVNSRQEVAYEALLAKAGDDYITDIKVQESWTYAFVGTVYTTTITATAYPKLHRGG